MKTLRCLSFTGLFGIVLASGVLAHGTGAQIDVQLVADGLVAPLDLTFAPDGSDRRFIVDQTGLVLVLKSDFDPTDPVKSGFVKSIGQDADGELYAVTGNFTPTGLQGRVWKIIDASE